MTQKYFTRFSRRLQDGNMEEVAKQYQGNYVVISNYIKTLLDKSISDFNIQNPPEDWTTYFDLLAHAQAKTKTWTRTIWSDLGSIPQEISINSKAIKDRFDRIGEICEDLQKSPTDDISIEDLRTNMERLLKGIKSMMDGIGRLLDSITQFDGEITEIANDLKQIADMSLHDKEVDEQKIEQLEADIKAAKNEVSSLAAEIAGASVGLVASVGVAVLSFGIGGPLIGGVITIFLGIPIAISATVIATDSIKIHQLNQKIQLDSESLTRYEADVLQLKMMADEFSLLSEQAVALKENLRFMFDIWADLYDDISEVNAEVQQASDNSAGIPDAAHTSEDWHVLQLAMEKAKSDFIVFVDKSQYFEVSGITGIDAEVELDMSEEEIEKLLKASRKMDLITYLTA